MPKIDITKLNAELKGGQFWPVYVVVGEESHLAITAVQLITEAILGRDANGSAKTSFLGKDADAQMLYDALKSISMFSPKNLVIIREADKLKKDVLDSLFRYLQSPSPASTLVIEAKKLDGRSKFMKAVEKQSVIVECKSLYANQVPSWINIEVARLGKRISMEAARFLGDMVGADLGQLKMSIERVSLYVGERDLIELKDIEEAVIETAQRTVFELSDAIGMRKVDKALSTLTNLLEAGQAPVFILNMISRHIRLLIKTREVSGKIQSMPELARYLGVHPFFVKNYVSQSRNFSAKELRRFFNLLSRCDRALKSSRLPRERILEKLLFELCGQKNAIPCGHGVC